MTRTHNIVVLGTGGTISCQHADNGDIVPTLTTEQIVNHAELDTDLHLECRDVMQLDSSNITLEDIDSLLNAIGQAIDDGATEIILLHGTDSMEETAMAVHCFFSGTVPIVITGAQRPQDDPHPDGPANIRQAVAALTSTNAEPTVQIAFGGKVLPAYGASKCHTSADQAFTNTFSGEVPPRLAAPARLAGLRVAIAVMYAGADASLIPSGLDGLVLAGFGSGNIPSAVADAVRQVDYPVMMCSRVPEGSVNLVYGGSGGGAELARQGIRSGGSLRPPQGRIQLLCELALNRANAVD